MKLLFSLLVLLLIPTTNASDQGSIMLRKTSETESEVVYTFEAISIKPELIGISTTLLLPEELTFKNYQAGLFFEEEADDVTYLISPKANKPQELVIGIVTLGQSAATGNGIIVQLVFEKKTTGPSKTPQIIEAMASGISDDSRVDYDEILWQIESVLPTTGPFPMTNISILCGSVLFIATLYKFSFHNNFHKKTRGKTITRLSL